MTATACARQSFTGAPIPGSENTPRHGTVHGRFMMLFALLLCWQGGAFAQTCIDARGGQLVFDLPTALVTPQLQHNGLPFPANAADTAEIWLAQDGILQVKLGDTHLPVAPVRVVADTYDVVWRDLAPDNPTLPRNGYAVLMHNVSLLQDGTLPIDVSSVLLAGDVTLNGGAFPGSNYERGELVAVATDGSDDVWLADTNDGGFVRRVIAGEYAIVYRHIQGNQLVPFNKNALLTTVNVTSGMPVLALDITAHQSSGSFYFDGVLAVSSQLERGNIVLRRTQAHGLVDEALLGDTSDQTHEAWIIDANYAVHYQHQQGTSIVPLNEDTTVIARQAFDGSPLDVDVNTSTYQIEFQVNGAVATPSPLETGDVSVIDRGTGAETTIGESADQTTSMHLIPGNYDLVWRRIAGGTAVPANDYKRFAENVTFADGGLIIVPMDINIPMVASSIDLDLDGQPWNTADGSATLRLFDSDETYSRLLGSSDAAPWSFNLIPGNYRAHYSHDAGNAVPRNGLALLPGTTTIGAGTTTLHLHSIDIDPTLTIDGNAFPVGQSATLSLLGDSGVMSFGSSTGNWAPARALQGIYRLYYSHDSGDDLPQNAAYQALCVNAAPCLFCSGFEES